jgi:hypothetical protein
MPALTVPDTGLGATISGTGLITTLIKKIGDYSIGTERSPKQPRINSYVLLDWCGTSNHHSDDSDSGTIRWNQCDHHLSRSRFAPGNCFRQVGKVSILRARQDHGRRIHHRLRWCNCSFLHSGVITNDYFAKASGNQSPRRGD